MEKNMPMAIVAILIITLGSPVAWALDEKLYAEVLQRYTVAVDDIASTRVDYGALRTSKRWRELLRSLRDSEPRRHTSRNEKLSFWINAYNILAMDMVRRHYPIDSIRDVGNFFSPVWKRAAGEIGGRSYTLHEIEHGILRPMREPRIHAAIVCASISCPPLRREPYRADVLDAQLHDNVARWLADPRKGFRIDRTTHTLHLSPILDWFSEDFDDDVLAFVGAHVSREDADWIRTRGSAAPIRYFDYNWGVNDVLPGSPFVRAKARTRDAAPLAPERSRTRAVRSKHLN